MLIRINYVFEMTSIQHLHTLRSFVIRNSKHREKVANIGRNGLSLLLWTGATKMRFSTLALVLDFTARSSDITSPKEWVRWPRWPGNRTSRPMRWFWKCWLRNWVTCLLKWVMHHHAAAKAFAWCEEEQLKHWQRPDVKRSSKYKRQ